jgi:GNAT superfamily N-acetyltransferase
MRHPSLGHPKTEMPVSIRPARPTDAEAIAGLTAQLGYDVAVSDLSERLLRIVTRPDQQVLLAQADGVVVGWVHTAIAEFLEAARFVIVAGLVVDSAHRRQRVGRTLMAHAEQWAREQGCSIVRLWSSSGRIDAHRFYDDLGYTRIKTQLAFAKALTDSPDDLRSLMPRLPAEEAGLRGPERNE